MPRTPEDLLQSEANAAVAAVRHARDAVTRHLDRHRKLRDAALDVAHWLESHAAHLHGFGHHEDADVFRVHAEKLFAAVGLEKARAS